LPGDQVFRLLPSAELANVPDRIGTTFVQARALGYLLGLTVTWDGTVGTFTDGYTTLELRHRDGYATVRDATGTFQVPIMAHRGAEGAPDGFQVDARIIDGRFMVPLAFFPEVFPNISVSWISAQEGADLTRLW
jgi:hypothetical protein